MLVTFKSANSADVIMFQKNGQEMLAVLGKESGAAQGIISVAQLPAAIAALKLAMSEAKAVPAERSGTKTDDGDAANDEVSLQQRAVPLLGLLEDGLKDHEPVTWGV